MKYQKRFSPAFTIVELLIVIVVIAILAAISIVAYNGIQNRTRASASSSAATQAAKKLEIYKVDSSIYPMTGSLGSAGVTNSTGTSYQYTSTDGTSYCLTASTSGVSYSVSSTNRTPQVGACSGQVDGGTIINLAYNPSGITGISGWSSWPGNGGGAGGMSSVAAGWSTRGQAVRNTWSTSATNTTGDIGWMPPSSGNAFSLQPNKQYTATWRVLASKSSQLLNPTVSNCAIQNGSSGSGSVTINSSSGVATTSAGVPISQRVTFTTGNATLTCKVYAASNGGSTWQTGEYLEMSDFMLVEGSNSYSFADGNSAGWNWNGTSNNSTSFGPPL